MISLIFSFQQLNAARSAFLPENEKEALISKIRAGWPKENFAKEYPNEKTYRHSLKEEASAMRAAIKVLDKQTGDASLQVIRKLDKEGLLEAFILLALPDAGIANDFPAYRKTNVEELRRYVKQYVMTGGGKP